MKRIKRILAFILTLLILSSCASFAASSSIVSPVSNSIVVGDSLLISVKLTDIYKVRVTVYEEFRTDAKGNIFAAPVSNITEEEVASTAAIYADAVKNDKLVINEDAGTASYGVKIDGVTKNYIEAVYAEPVEYLSTSEVGFYTKQLSKLEPGLFRVKVETIDERGTVVKTQSSFVALVAKADTTSPAEDASSSVVSKALKIVQRMLKSLFK